MLINSNSNSNYRPEQEQRHDDYCDMQGIRVILGLLPLGSTLYMSTLDSTMWSTQVFEYPREYLST